MLRKYFTPIVVALIAWGYLLCHLDPTGSYPGMPEGPGLTIDETFNVQQGVILVEALRTYGLGLLSPEAIQEVFSPPLHLPDHPPLGRFWLGVHHHLLQWLAPPDDPDGPFVTACARAGSATAFALTILIVGCCATAWYGDWAGLMASLSFAVVPRLLGHAHLAALETVTNLTCTAATLSVLAYWDSKETPRLKTAAWTGAIFGLALLSKIQAVLVPVPIVLWALVRWRQRALIPLAVWGGVALGVFFVGWPWLWLDPVDHLRQYVSGATNRAELSVWYLGHKYTHRTVPWHYALAYWWWTIPFKLHFLGFVGMFAMPANKGATAEERDSLIFGRWRPREILLVIASIWPVCFFALPRVPIYDCERLWLPALPVWLILVGRGADILLIRMQRWWPNAGSLFRCVFLTLALVQALSLSRYGPTYLSFYGGLAGGMSGAQRGGLELNYWGDAVTRGLLKDIALRTPPGSVIAMTPVLHQFQTEELLRQSPILRRHGVRLIPYEADASFDYILLFRRLADLPPEFSAVDLEGWSLVSEVESEGVQLAGLYRRDADPPEASQP